MVEITPRAEQHLLQLRSERGFDQQSGARFEANDQRVRLTFSTAPASRDRVIKGADLPIFVAPKSSISSSTPRSTSTQAMARRGS